MQRLPSEMLEHIALQCDNRTAAAFALTCIRHFEAVKRQIRYTVSCCYAHPIGQDPENVSTGADAKTAAESALRLVHARSHVRRAACGIRFDVPLGDCNRILASACIDGSVGKASEALLDILSLQLPSLREVSVTSFALPYFRLCKALVNHTKLESLTIVGRRSTCTWLTDEQCGMISLYQLSAFVANCTSLTSLTVERMRKSDGLGKQPQTFWPDLPPHLSSLSLVDMDGTDEEMLLLVGSQKVTLKHLTLVQSKTSAVTTEGVRRVLLACSRSLRTLYLGPPVIDVSS